MTYSSGIKIIREKIGAKEIEFFLGNPFHEMIKFVADIEKGILALGGELHSDAEALLLESGSSQKDLWGANFYPRNPKEKRIEYTSLINIRPSVGNRSMEVKDLGIQKRIQNIVERLLP